MQALWICCWRGRCAWLWTRGCLELFQSINRAGGAASSVSLFLYSCVFHPFHGRSGRLASFSLFFLKTFPNPLPSLLSFSYGSGRFFFLQADVSTSANYLATAHPLFPSPTSSQSPLQFSLSFAPISPRAFLHSILPPIRDATSSAWSCHFIADMACHCVLRCKSCTRPVHDPHSKCLSCAFGNSRTNRFHAWN